MFKEKSETHRIEEKFKSSNQKDGGWTHTIKEAIKIYTEYKVKNEDFIDAERASDKFTHFFYREKRNKGVVKKFDENGVLVFLNQYELLVVTEYRYDIHLKSEEVNSNYILTGKISRWSGDEKKTSTEEFSETYFFNIYKSDVLNVDELSNESETEADIVSYHSNGKEKAIGTLVNGKIDGKWEEFAANGETTQATNYFRSEINGKYKTYYDYGSPKEKGAFVNCIKKGVWLTWHENNQIKD